jgi:alpha-tubulin suppressor-like RCC1 family protein
MKPTTRARRRLRRLPALALLLAACWQPTAAPTAPPAPVSTTPTPTPVTTAAVDPIVELASQSLHTCARRRSGTVLCWGKNTYGQLGNGSREDSSRLVKVEGLQDAVELAVGRDFSCARREAGGVVCWGNDENGQLGDGRGPAIGALSLRPVAVAGLRQPMQLATGEHHVCALEQAGTVQCWGNASNGQLGSDAQRAFGKPRPIERLGRVRRIASGVSHVCALETSGIVQCWGRNTEGQLGDGKSGSRIKPVVVAGLEDVVDLASGHRHTCARTRDGRVWCWGDNAAAQLGPNAGRDPKRGTPVEVEGLAGVVELAGGSDHTCARLQTGRAMCWGSNAAGQLGQRSTVTRVAEPTAVRGMSDAIDLALGAQHTCALRKTGEIACVGDPEHGALGPYRLI